MNDLTRIKRMTFVDWPWLLTEINTDGFRSNIVIDHLSKVGQNLLQCLTGGEIVPVIVRLNQITNSRKNRWTQFQIPITSRERRRVFRWLHVVSSVQKSESATNEDLFTWLICPRRNARESIPVMDHGKRQWLGNSSKTRERQHWRGLIEMSHYLRNIRTWQVNQ